MFLGVDERFSSSRDAREQTYLAKSLVFQVIDVKRLAGVGHEGVFHSGFAS